MPNVKSPNEINDDYHDKAGQGKFYEDYKPTNVSSRAYEEIKISKDKTVIKLIDKIQRDLLSIVLGKFIKHHGKDYFEIQYTWSKNKRRGFLTYLFEVIIYDLNLIIISDGNHSSPGSKEFWKSHISKNKFEIYRYDLNSNYKRNAKKYNDDRIWGLTSSELAKIKAQKAKFKSFPEISEAVILDENFHQEVQIQENIDEANAKKVAEFNLTFGESIDDKLAKFDYKFEESTALIEDYKKFILEYQELIKSKEQIRLVAQKVNQIKKRKTKG